MRFTVRRSAQACVVLVCWLRTARPADRLSCLSVRNSPATGSRRLTCTARLIIEWTPSWMPSAELAMKFGSYRRAVTTNIALVDAVWLFSYRRAHVEPLRTQNPLPTSRAWDRHFYNVSGQSVERGQRTSANWAGNAEAWKAGAPVGGQRRRAIQVRAVRALMNGRSRRHNPWRGMPGPPVR